METNITQGLVSIVIPVYNKKEYIEGCLDAISKQIYSNYEVIIIDDGSTDGSSGICDDMAVKYPWVKVIHKKNGGVSSARNVGIHAAHGEWLCFVDADDCPLPEMLDKMVCEDAALVVCNWSSENKYLCSDKFTEPRKVCTMRNDDTLLLCTPDFFKTIWNKLFRTDIIKSSNIWYEEDICHAEDSIFAIDYYAALDIDAKIVLLQQPLYIHRDDVKGSLVRDRDVVKWRLSASYWWKHINSANFSDAVRNDMLVRCLQNEFLVFAMERNYRGLRDMLRDNKTLISMDTVKYWPRMKQLVLLSKSAWLIYLANRIWMYLM